MQPILKNMKHKIKCTCLIDSKTKQPLELEINMPKEKLLNIRRAAHDSGLRFKLGLQKSGVID